MRDALIEPSNPRSLAGRARERRWATLNERFPHLEAFRVLDLGGTLGSWEQSPVMPCELTILNLDSAGQGETRIGGSTVRHIAGDACNLPSAIEADRFDLVFSNSVIEHVGGHYRRHAFAETVRKAAPRCWVQTPYRYFPIEPHFVFPGAQFLPLSARSLLPQKWPLSFCRSTDRQGAVRATQEIELVSITDMRAYFPDADVLLERIIGIPKSIIVVRDEL